MLSKKSGIGIVIGRFQVPSLSKGHVNLFEAALESHDSLMVILGSTTLRNTKRNPLDFETRRRMIADIYPEATILNLMDTPDDVTWVKNLDALISANVPPGTAATLYGSRDSFLEVYNGKYKTVSIPHCDQVSGTEVREAVSLEPSDTIDFRKGMIKASQQRYNSVIMCVDVAPIVRNADGERYIVMIKKKEDNGKVRFIGGHVEPNNPGKHSIKHIYLEHSAMREAYEEAGIASGKLSDIHYIGSFYVSDWRYKGESDAIITAFFVMNNCETTNLVAGDDADEVVLVHPHDIITASIDVVYEHETLLIHLANYLKQN